MAHGHMIPMTDIAKIFSARGVKSTIVTTPLNAVNISSKITRCQSSGFDIDIKTLPFPCEEVGLPKDGESSDAITTPEMAGKFFQAISMLEPAFERLVEEVHPDCIVSDMFFPWTYDVGHKHGIPRLVFHGTSFFSLSLSDSLSRNSLYECRDETFEVPGLPDKIYMKSSQMPTDVGAFKEMRERIRATEKASYGVVVNSFYELEPAYADHYRKVVGRGAWHIGPVSLTNTSIIDKAERGKKGLVDDHYCLNWLDSKEPRSVIYVSFGSASHFACTQLTKIAEGLEASGVPFIWVVRMLKEDKDKKFLPDGFEERTEGKGLVIRDWAPQVLILDHSAIGGFMTHCGWNSILEGVSAGLPMITWPLFAEQFQNEILVTQVLKTGIKVGVEKFNSWTVPVSDSVTKETVEKMVSQLMVSEEGEEISKRARELKEMSKRAMEEGGSSHSDLTTLIEELQQQRNGAEACK